MRKPIFDMVKDRFSNQAVEYSKSRPGYPSGVYTWIYGHVPAFSAALDTGCGNGQVALQLSRTFKKVYATDISQAQLARAPKRDNITYVCRQVEKSGMPKASLDLICVAQAVHWFDVPAFLREADRILVPGGVLALWGYGLPRIQPEIDDLIFAFYRNQLGAFWDPERKHIESRYETLPAPPGGYQSAQFVMQHAWHTDRLDAYLRSWSAYQKLLQQQEEDPLPILMEKIRALVIGPEIEVHQDIFVKLWKKP